MNFHTIPTSCPKEIYCQENIRLTRWSRYLALKVGRFVSEEEEDVDQEDAEEYMWRTVAENGRYGGAMSATAAIPRRSQSVHCPASGGGGGGISCSSSSRIAAKKMNLEAWCMSLLGDMKADAAELRDWHLHRQIVAAKATLESFMEFLKFPRTHHVSFLLSSEDGGALVGSRSTLRRSFRTLSLK